MSKRLLFVVSEDWYFVSHRLHLAIAAIKEGYEVTLLCRCNNHKQMVEDKGIQVIDWPLARGSHNPFKELRALFVLIKMFAAVRPNIIHAVAVKPVLYSSVAAKITRVKPRVFALGGLGYLFSSKRARARVLKLFVVTAYRFALAGKKTKLILQNKDDVKVLLRANVIQKEKIKLIRGSGVDTTVFKPEQFKHVTPLVILPSRMLWDKGVGEFVECARLVRQSKKNVRFALIGSPDLENPESISIAQLKTWVSDGIVEWWGKRTDMPEVYKQSTVVCFPSYREGLPKTLLEAASCGKPIVAFNVPGCREIVIDGKNGFLVPFKNTEKLVDSINILLGDEQLRKKFGTFGREKVVNEFSQERVVEETLDVWTEVLS
ncbi:MAG: glycosyltransferase family 4 protein [Nitrospinae bacterium]|nr:glycosyltransferase family 4 protein [Nitrospinota bacterium]